MSSQKTLWDTTSGISLPGLQDGASPSAPPGFQTTSKSAPPLSRVSRGQALVPAGARRTSATSHPSFFDSSKHAGSRSSLESKSPQPPLSDALAERLSKVTDRLGSTLYSMGWRHHVTPAGRSLFLLAASAHRTSGSVSTGEPKGWPTPVKSDSSNTRNRSANRTPGGHHHDGQTLVDAADLAGWPTPRTTDYKGGNGKTGNRSPEASAKAGFTLSELARLTADHHSFPHDLPNMAEWCDQPARLTVFGDLLTGSSAGMESGGQLNPRASLWLMLGPYAEKWLRAAERVQRVRKRKKN